MAYEYTKPPLVLNPYVAVVGDDIYAKPAGADWQDGGAYADDMIASIVKMSNNGLTAYNEWLLDIATTPMYFDKSYVVFKNAHLAVITSSDDGADRLTCAGHSITADGAFYFRGTSLPANIVAGKKYFCKNPTTDDFQVSLTSGGAAIDLGAVSGAINMYVTASQFRSASDTVVAFLAASEEAIQGEGQTARDQAIEENVLELLRRLANAKVVSSGSEPYRYTTGNTLHWFPCGVSLGTWNANRVAATERSAPNLGIYDATLDDSVSMTWALFNSAVQPSGWDEAIDFRVLFPYDGTLADINAKTDLIGTVRSQIQW